MANPNNRLGSEKSPYLSQHKDNPVNWYPWGEEAFEAAKKQKKPIFLSVGYSTCYWCHVMEKDSFEREEVANVLNKYFIAIKVDREERPDIDQIYMDAVVTLNGHGGWPMSVFMTPELKPFYGGTFFYRDKFIELLENIHENWTTNKDNISQAATRLTEALKTPPGEQSTQNLGKDSLKRFLYDADRSFDISDGGFGRAPKFPPSDKIAALLRLAKETNDKKALTIATTTLDKMARGGLYDHLGGGFHRYSTDAKWLVPHFEKMLYDNALLATVYLEAFQLTGNKTYKYVAKETLDYVLTKMTDSEGGFYSAEDAGEVDKEGEFYVWKGSELKKLLSTEEYELLSKVYGVTDVGNFEGNSILNLQSNYAWDIKYDSILKSTFEKLYVIREKREHPHKDDKILTAWNGLMITAMSFAGGILEEEKYLQAAQSSASFIKENLYNNGTLLRRFRDGEAAHPATLDDYAYLIQGLITLFEADYDEAWINWAVELQAIQDKLFWDKSDFGYFFSVPNDKSIIVRKKEFTDGAKPSSNAISATNLLKLYDITFNKDYLSTAEKLFARVSATFNRYPFAFGATAIALSYKIGSAKEIVVIGDDNAGEGKKLADYLKTSFIPNKVAAFGSPATLEAKGRLPFFRGKEMLNGKTTFYVCENNTCKLPTNNFDQARKLIEGDGK